MANNVRYTSNLRRAKELLNEAQIRTLYGIGEYALTEVKERAPVKTGNLKNSYDYKVNENKKRLDTGTNVEYAPNQEFGIGIKRAQPHLKPAFEDNVAEIKRLASELMRID